MSVVGLTPEGEALALTLYCRECGAKPGEHCKSTLSGKRIYRLHFYRRLDAAEQVKS